MFAEESVSYRPAIRVRMGRQLAGFVRRSVQRAAAATHDWIRVPLSYAKLWEASLMMKRREGQCDYEPDPYSTEAAFLTDGWLAVR